jgi:hypothetical protein
VGIDVWLALLAAGTAWARVEAGQHYPADVLAGVALGRFLGDFMSRLFFEAEGDPGVRLAITGRRDGPYVWASVRLSI